MSSQIPVTFDNRCPSCVIADEKASAVRKASAEFASRAVFAEEMVRVALRMLKREGRLKPTTDDERAAVELAGYFIDLPAASRRLLRPMTEDYVRVAVQVGQATLFEI